MPVKLSLTLATARCVAEGWNALSKEMQQALNFAASWLSDGACWYTIGRNENRRIIATAD